MNTAISISSGTSNTINLTSSNQQIGKAFLTPPSEPATNQIPSGAWAFQVYADTNTTGDGTSVTLSFGIYKYSSGVESTIVNPSTNSTQLINDQGVSLYTALIPMPQTSLLSTDRIVVKFFGKSTSPSSKTLTLYFNDATIGLVSTTFAQGIVGLGNVLTVDSIFGNDTAAAISGHPYLTVNAAVNGITGSNPYTIWILPGTYNMTSGITIPQNCSIRGMRLQTTTLQMAGITAGTTLVTMGTQTRIEDLTLTISSATSGITTTGIYFPDGSATTGKVRACVVNTTTTATDANSNIYGIYTDGSGTSITPTSLYAVQRTTVNVTSGATGNAVALYVHGATPFNVRDAVFFTTGITASAAYCAGVVADVSGANVAIQSSTISGSKNDILQGTAAGLTYSSQPIIKLSGTNLVNANADANGFGTGLMPNQMVFYVYGKSGAGGISDPNTYCLPPGGIIQTSLLKTDTRFLPIPMIQKCILISANIMYTGTGPDNKTLTVKIYNSTSISSFTPSTPILTQIITPSLAGNGPFFLQNVASTFTPNTNYLFVTITPSGPGWLPDNDGLYISLGFY
jgi:hypothetical protein